MASLDILCSNPLNLKNKITKIEHKNIFCGPSKILKNIWWPINICLKYFMSPRKTLLPPSYILNMWSLNGIKRVKSLENILYLSKKDVQIKRENVDCYLAVRGFLYHNCINILLVCFFGWLRKITSNDKCL